MSRVELSKIADLARLKLGAEELAQFESDLDRILDYVDALSSVSTDGVEPMVHPFAEAIEGVLRADEARPSLGAETLLEVAPESLFDSYKVPQVVGG